MTESRAKELAFSIRDALVGGGRGSTAYRVAAVEKLLAKELADAWRLIDELKQEIDELKSQLEQDREDV